MIFKEMFSPPTGPTQSAKRVAAFIDSQSIWGTPLRLYQDKVDYIALRDFIANNRNLVGCDVVVTIDPAKSLFRFLDILKKNNYRLHIRSIYAFSTAAQRDECESSPWTPEIVDEIRRSEWTADVIAIVGTDPVYSHLATELRKKGKEVELICWPEDVPPEFDQADKSLRPLNTNVLMKRERTTI